MELQTERLTLRPMSDAELQTLMEAVRPRDAELADAYNDMLRGSREHPQARLWYTAWGAYRKDTGELVGDLCFKGPSAQPEIGYGMIEAFWGRGYATESAGAMCRWALAQPSPPSRRRPRRTTPPPSACSPSLASGRPERSGRRARAFC